MNIAIKDACSCTFYDRNTGKPEMYSDYFNTFSLSVSQESVYAKAKGQNKIGFAGAKEVSIQMESEVIEPKYLAILLGSEMVEGVEAELTERRVITLGADKKIDITGAVDGTVSVFGLERDMRTHTVEMEISPVTTNARGMKEVVVADGFEGQSVVVYFLTKKPNTKKITVGTKTKAKNFKINALTTLTNEFGEEDVMAINIFNARPQANLEIGLNADSPANFSATFDLLADEKNEMFELVIVDEDNTAVIDSFLKEAKTVEKK